MLQGNRCVCVCVYVLCLKSVGYQQLFAPTFVQAALKGAAMLQGNRCVCVCVCMFYV